MRSDCLGGFVDRRYPLRIAIRAAAQSYVQRACAISDLLKILRLQKATNLELRLLARHRVRTAAHPLDGLLH